MTSNTVNMEQEGWGGGVVEPLPCFWYVAVLWKDFAFSEEAFIFSSKWGIYGWWRYWVLVMSPNMVAILAAILDFTQLVIFLCLTCKMTHKLVLCFILSTDFVFIVKKGWKHALIFSEKMNHPLLMTSYLLTIVTVHHQTYLKMHAKDKRTVTENVRWSCLIV